MHGFTRRAVSSTARLLAVGLGPRAPRWPGRARWTGSSYENRARGPDRRPPTSGGDPIDRYLDDVIIHGSPSGSRPHAELRESIGLEIDVRADVAESYTLFPTRC